MSVHKGLILVSLVLLASLVVLDSYRIHFDKDLVEQKAIKGSAQRHWNFFYGQEHVYFKSPFRYQQDIVKLSELIEPGSAVISDLATSHYLAATLPVYVRNTHRHQGRYRSRHTSQLLDKTYLCYIKYAEYLDKTKRLLRRDQRTSDRQKTPIINYIVLNKDQKNATVQRDCLGSRDISKDLLGLSNELYEGQFLRLYEIDIED